MLNNSAEKSIKLQEVSEKIDTLKVLLRLAKDCKCISNTQYLNMESLLYNAGKMTGGWLNKVRQLAQRAPEGAPLP